MEDQGYSAAEIGELLAIFMLMRVVSPNLWGWVADHTRHRAQLTRWLAVAATLAFCTVFFGDSYAVIALCLVLFSLFWHAINPQLEAVTLNHLGADVHRYSLIRLWGSIGFIVAVVALGPFLEVMGTWWLLPVLVMLLASTAIIGFFVPGDNGYRASPPQYGFVTVLRRPEVIGLLLVSFLMQVSHGPYYAFFSIYLQDAGYTRGEIGVLWGLGVLAEVVLFIVMHRIFNGFSLRFLLLTSLLLTGLRWLLIAHFVDSMLIMLLAQILHAASFGLFHAVAVQLVHHHFTHHHQVRGQALYSSISYGIGGGIGSLAAGGLWDSHGAVWVYSLAAAATAVALVIAWVTVKFGKVAPSRVTV